jgi:hypothetical protein
MFDIFVIRDKKIIVCGEQTTTRLNRKICACVQLAELKTTWRIKITSSCLVFNSASYACANFPIQARCRLLAAHDNFFVTNDENIKHV